MPRYGALLNGLCRETKAKVITLTNQKGRRQAIGPIKTRNKCNRREARENEGKRVTTGFSFTLIGWEKGPSFLSQSCSVVLQSELITFRHLNKNRFISPPLYILSHKKLGYRVVSCLWKHLKRNIRSNVIRRFDVSNIIIKNNWNRWTSKLLNLGTFSIFMSLCLWPHWRYGVSWRAHGGTWPSAHGARRRTGSHYHLLVIWITWKKIKKSVLFLRFSEKTEEISFIEIHGKKTWIYLH